MVYGLISIALDASQTPAEALDLSTTAAWTMLGMPPEKWIPIIISIVGVLITIIGVVITIRTLRADIKHQYEQKTREDKAVLSEMSKVYYAEMQQLLRSLINSINTAIIYSEQIGIRFVLNPYEYEHNNLLTHYVVREDTGVTEDLKNNRTNILRVYSEICELQKNAPRYIASIDSFLSKLEKHMLQALVIERNPHLLSEYHKICTAPFPSVPDLVRLSDTIEAVLNTTELERWKTTPRISKLRRWLVSRLLRQFLPETSVQYITKYVLRNDRRIMSERRSSPDRRNGDEPTAMNEKRCSIGSADRRQGDRRVFDRRVFA